MAYPSDDFAALPFFAKSYIHHGCVIHHQCLHLVVHILYLYLAQECQTAVAVFLSEACLFVIRMEDSFDFHVKKTDKSPFRLWHYEIIFENSRQSSFILSRLFLPDDWLGLALA